MSKESTAHWYPTGTLAGPPYEPRVIDSIQMASGVLNARDHTTSEQACGSQRRGEPHDWAPTDGA